MMRPMTTSSDVDTTSIYERADGDYRGNWIQTYTGRAFYPFEPWKSEVRIEDIAHALALTCRFTGHCEHFYSVAQHCVLASQLVPECFALEALLHDAGEAYLCDLPSPVKAGMSFFKDVERVIEQRVMHEFGICEGPPEELLPDGTEIRRAPYAMSAPVKHVDLLLVATEARDLMANPPTMWQLPVEPLAGLRIEPWDWREAERQYLRRFEALTRKTR